MNQPADFWRTEVFHPLSVHFPIAILSIATVFVIVSLFSKNPLWKNSGAILLIIGTVSAWVSIYTGDLADGIVSRTICDPTVLKAHENFAYYTAWSFSIASFIVILQHFIHGLRIIPLARIVVLLSMIAGTYFLVEAGHKGAKVVYQQAGGVYVPSADCAEFE